MNIHIISRSINTIIIIITTRMAAFQGMHVSPAKYSAHVTTCTKMCDYQIDRHMDGQTDR